MKKILIGLAAMASLSLTACGGGSVCDQRKDAFESLGDKAVDSCGLTVNPEGNVTDAQVDVCNENIDKCSDSEKESLEKFNDCVSDIPKCSDKSEAQQEAFTGKLVGCALSNLTSLSETCADAFLGQ